MTKEKSLTRYLHQAVGQVFASHHLLEFCCATNSYKKGAKYCLPRIFTLSYHLSTLENILKSTNPNKTTLEKLVKSYEDVKCNTDVLMCEISAALNYVKPANQSSFDSEWTVFCSVLTRSIYRIDSFYISFIYLNIYNHYFAFSSQIHVFSMRFAIVLLSHSR